MSAVLLETFGLTKHFGGVTALSGVDFRLQEGELRCVIGPNGAGKSTFFKCLTGQHRWSSGEVKLRSESLKNLERHEIAQRGVGIKTQVPCLFEGLTVRENIWVSASRVIPACATGARIGEAMERLGVHQLADSMPNRLSHGHRQLVELTMVIVADPALILLDEPAAGMTDEEVEHLIGVLKEINGSHTLVVVEHDMHFVRQIASTVTVFHEGRVLVSGNVNSILQNETVKNVYLGSEAA